MNTLLSPYNNHGSSKLDDLILLESEDDQHDETVTLHQTQAQLDEETRQLQLASRNKFMKAWSGILRKYEQIDDDLQSDEVDIITGKIYKDNGHLKSLSKVEGIWDDVDEDELYKKRRDTKPMGFLEDNLLLGPSPTKKKKLNHDDLRDISPTKGQVPSLSYKNSPIKNKSHLNSSPVKNNSSNPSLHYDLLLGPSPTKKKKILKDMDSSSMNHDLDDISPTKGMVPSSLNLNSSPVKSRNNLNYSSPIKSKLSSTNLSNQHLNKENISILSSSTQISGDSDSQSSHIYTSDSDDNTTYIKSQSFTDLARNQHLNKEDLSIISSSTQIFEGDSGSDSESSQEDPSSTQFDYPDSDDNTHIVSSSDIPPSRSIPFVLYSCYFKCDYCTGNKLLFKDHLLENHSPELKSLGYPVNVEQEVNVDNEAEILHKITSLFPLYYEIPLVNTSDNGRTTGDIWYLSDIHKQSTNNDLVSNQVEVPNQRSIHECPILGCEFLKTRSYSDWRNHMKQNHDVGREVKGNGTNGNAKMLKLDSNKKPDLKTYQYSSDINEWWDDNSDLELDTE